MVEEHYEGEAEREEARRKIWRYHIQHEIPHSSDQISYAFVKRGFVDACCKTLEEDRRAMSGLEMF